MPKKIIKKYLSNIKDISKISHLQGLNTHLSNPFLWHLNRHSMANAVSIGLFVGYLPFPGHMIVASFFAIFLRANLPLAVLLVWISNPFTIGPMFYLSHKLGAILLHQPHENFHFEMSHHWFLHEFYYYFEPLLLGSILCGAILAVIGNLIVRLLWRLHITYAWHQRRIRK